MSWKAELKTFKEVSFGIRQPTDYYLNQSILEYYAAYFESEEISVLIYFSDTIVGWLGMTLRKDVLDFHGFPIRFISFCESSRIPVGLDIFLLKILEESAQGKPIKICWNDVQHLFPTQVNLYENNFCYVDLAKDEASILKGVRSSYRSLINKGKREVEIQVTAESTTWETFLEAKKYHEKISGRQTRSDMTWEIQYKLLINSKAFLVRGCIDGSLVSLTYVNYANLEAYYGFGVYDRELMHAKVSISHWPLIAAIFHAKKIGLKYFNLGNVGPSFATSKEENIALFKRGFSSDLRKEIVWTIN